MKLQRLNKGLKSKSLTTQIAIFSLPFGLIEKHVILDFNNNNNTVPINYVRIF